MVNIVFTCISRIKKVRVHPRVRHRAVRVHILQVVQRQHERQHHLVKGYTTFGTSY